MMSYGDPARQKWALPQEQAEPIVRRAAEAGVTFFEPPTPIARARARTKFVSMQDHHNKYFTSCSKRVALALAA